MSVDTKDLELVRNIIPKKQIIEFELLSELLSDEVKFGQQVQNLCGDKELPLVFPSLPLFFRNHNEGLVTNKEYREMQLTLPSVLYNSETYNLSLELRGPMEEILLAYEKERIRQGMLGNDLSGDGWTKIFKRRFKRVKNQPIGEYENKLDKNLDKTENNLKINKDFLNK